MRVQQLNSDDPCLFISAPELTVSTLRMLIWTLKGTDYNIYFNAPLEQEDAEHIYAVSDCDGLWYIESEVPINAIDQVFSQIT